MELKSAHACFGGAQRLLPAPRLARDRLAHEVLGLSAAQGPDGQRGARKCRPCWPASLPKSLYDQTSASALAAS